MEKLLRNLKTSTAIFTLFILFFSSTSVSAQSTANYAFSTGTNGSLAQDMNGNTIDFTSGATTRVAAGVDDTPSALANIGFDFWFMGTVYTQFSASDNGQIGLGASPTTNNFELPNSNNNALATLAPFANDLRVGTNGLVQTKVFGTAPNRCFVVEWTNIMIKYLNTAAAGTATFQLRLYETTGVIEYMYGAMATNAATPAAYYVGFSNAATANRVLTVNTTAHTATTSATVVSNSYAASSTIASLNSATNGSRRFYRFTNAAATAPTAMTFSNIAATTMTVNWTDNATNELGYVVYLSTDNVNFTRIGTLAANSTSSNITGLIANTVYYYRVYAYREGALGTPATGSQITLTEFVLSSASNTWTPPACGITSITVDTWGAGGGGGSSNNTGARGGGGGGGGAYARGTHTVAYGNTYYYNIGTGGNGGPANSTTAATAGTSTWFRATAATNAAPTTNVLGTLAAGGAQGLNNTNPAGGAGGTTAASLGNVTRTAGTAGGNSSNNDGGDGGNGANSTGTGGAGSSSTDGDDGIAPGGGGGGSDDNASAHGGNGGSGQIIITYQLPTAQTATPVITGSVCAGATSVIGTSSEANGTIIEIFKNGVSQGTTTVTSNAWTKTGLTLVASDVIIAEATSLTPCKRTSDDSASIVIVAVPVSGTLTPSIAAGTICQGQNVSATATAGSGGAGTIVDELEYSLSGGTFTAYVSGTSISTAGQNAVSIRTRRTATGSGCTSSAYNTVSWTVNAVPAAGTLTPNVAAGAVCSGQSVSATATAGSGGAGTIVDELERSLSGGAYAAYTSGTAISTTGQTSVSIRTRRTATGSGCTASSYNTVTWTVNAVPASGTLTPTPAAGTVCSGGTVSATATAGSGGAGTIVDELEYSLSGGSYIAYTSGTSINTTGQTSISIRTRRTATGSGCTTSSYNTVSWTINAAPASGTLTPNVAAGAVCSGQNVSATATAGSGGAGTIVDELERSLSGGAYAAYTSGTAISTTGQTSISIRTRRTATGSSCTASSYNTVTWTVNAVPASGTLTPTPAAGTICSGGTVSATATAGSGGAGTIVDELEYSLSGGSYTAYTSGASINTTGQTSISIRTRRTATGSGCTTSSYNTVSWTINAAPASGTLTPNVAAGAVCSGQNVSATATAGSGGAGTIVDELERSLSGGAYAAYTSGTAISTTGQTSVSIRTRRTATGSGCTASSYNTVTWTVNAVPASGTLTPNVAAGAVCSGQSVSATATAGSGGAGTIVDELEYSLSGGSYTAYTSGTSISTTGQTSVSIRTRRTATGSGCTTSSYNTVAWTVNAAPSAGTLTPTPAAGTICSGGTVSATATAGSGGVGTIVDELQYSLSGGSYTTYTSGTAINTTGQTSISIRTRRTATGSGCTTSSYNTVTWNINARPTAAVLSGTGSICYGSSTNLQVAITGGTSPYSVVYSGGSVGSYTSGSNIPVSPTSTTTYTLTSVTDANGCVGTGNSGSPTVTIDSTTSTNGGVSWSNGTPTSTKSVVFDGSTATLAADLNACSLRLTNSAVVNVNSGINVTLDGKIIVESGSTFTLNNTSNLIQNTALANTGNIIVKRNSSALKRLDYTLWSSPVTGQGLYAFSPFTFANRFYVYNTSNDTYSNSVGFNVTGLNPDGVNGTDSNNVQFASAKGYLIRVPWNHPTAPAVWNGSFTGVPNNGNVSFGMTTGYNAVGNPYPSRINVHDFIDGNTNISGPLYFWRKTNDTNSSSYATLTKTAYVANGAAGGDTGTGFFNTGDEANWVINIGQGFLVNATSSTNLNFTNSMRRSSTANQFFKDSQNVVNTLGGLYWLNLNAPTGIFSQMAVGYSSEGTLAEDRGIDGKNINTDFFLTSLIGSTEYSIQGRPDFDAGDIVPLSYKVTAAGNYTVTIDHTAGLFDGTAQAIYLIDNLTATEHNLQNGAYAFTSDAGTFNNRFEVHYESQLSNPVFTENTVIIYSQNNEFVINSGNTTMSSVKVFDIRGRLLLEKGSINANQTTIKVGDANQVLLVQITSEDGAVVTKKVIR